MPTKNFFYLLGVPIATCETSNSVIDQSWIRTTLEAGTYAGVAHSRKKTRQIIVITMKFICHMISHRVYSLIQRRILFIQTQIFILLGSDNFMINMPGLHVRM